MASLDDAEKNKAFAESLDGDFPLLSDPDKQAAKAYGVLGPAGAYTKRWTFYIDRAGVIRHIDKSVDTASAGPDIVKQLDPLELSKPK